jgi:hypothetical protein
MGVNDMNITTDEMRMLIQEWFAQATSFEVLADIYYTVRSEADKQNVYMSLAIAKDGE